MRGADEQADAGGDEPQATEEPKPAAVRERPPRRRRPRRPKAEQATGAETDEVDSDAEAPESKEAVAEEAGEPVTGVLDVLPQGHGLLRLEGLDSTAEDVYVSASQIRRCELRAGDEIAGPARPSRRGERHPALIRVERVNGAEPVEERKGGDREADAGRPAPAIGDADRLRRRPDPGRRPAGAACIRPAGAGPGRAALRAHDPASRSGRRHRRRTGGTWGRRPARRRAAGGDHRPGGAARRAWRSLRPLPTSRLATSSAMPSWLWRGPSAGSSWARTSFS